MIMGAARFRGIWLRALWVLGAAGVGIGGAAIKHREGRSGFAPQIPDLIAIGHQLPNVSVIAVDGGGTRVLAREMAPIVS